MSCYIQSVLRRELQEMERMLAEHRELEKNMTQSLGRVQGKVRMFEARIEMLRKAVDADSEQAERPDPNLAELRARCERASRYVPGSDADADPQQA